MVSAGPGALAGPPGRLPGSARLALRVCPTGSLGPPGRA